MYWIIAIFATHAIFSSCRAEKSSIIVENFPDTLFCKICLDCAKEGTKEGEFPCDDGLTVCVKAVYGKYVTRLCGDEMACKGNKGEEVYDSFRRGIKKAKENAYKDDDHELNIDDVEVHCCNDKNFCNDAIQSLPSIMVLLSMALIAIHAY